MSARAVQPVRRFRLAHATVACAAALVLAGPGASSALAHGSSSNGCGSQGLSRGVPDKVPGSYDFHAACDRHDKGYGTWSRPKATTDRAFYSDMLKSCKVRLTDPLGIRCKNAATVYYTAVKTMGGKAYANGQRNAGLKQRLSVSFSLVPKKSGAAQFTQFWTRISGGHYSSLTCLLDGVAKAPCSTVMKFTVKPGMHRFQVVARNRAGKFSSPVYHWIAG